MATVFHLVRHGAYALLDGALGGRAPHPLSDEGRAQAGRLAEAFQAGTVSAVVSSPVRRAMETAHPIAARLGLPVHADPAFAEIDFAGWTGATFASLHADPAWRAWNGFRSTAAVPGGESMLAVQSRAVHGLARLAADYPGGELVIVSHGDVIKAVLAHLLGAPLDLLRRIEVGAGAKSTIILFDDDAKITGINLPP